MRHLIINKKSIIYVTVSSLLVSCAFSYLPHTGPSKRDIYSSAVSVRTEDMKSFIVLIEPDLKTVSRFKGKDVYVKDKEDQRLKEFEVEPYNPVIGTGDILEVVIHEEYPQVLLVQTGGTLTLPQLVVNEEGKIKLSYIGELYVRGKRVEEVAEEIRNGLRGKGNRFQVYVRLVDNPSSSVTVTGYVRENRKIRLNYATKTLLDVILQAGGIVSPVEKTLIRIEREGKRLTIPYDRLLKDPEFNINVRPGDVIYVIYKNQSVTVLGAAGRNEEVEIEAKGVTLNQLLARTGGLNPSIANAGGIFVFRFEDEEIVRQIVEEERKIHKTERGVPVVYSIDLRKPENFFITKNFYLRDGDIVYVATAPTVQLQHFLNLISSIISPIFMLDRMIRE